MEASCRFWSLVGSSVGFEATKRAGFRSSYGGVASPGFGPWWLGRGVGFEEEGAAHLSHGLSERWLRAIVIFALIHRPICRSRSVALGAQ